MSDDPNLPEDYHARAVAIMDEAVGQLVALAEERFNETCDCPDVHQFGAASWAIVYEHVDMREGGGQMAVPEVFHSPNSGLIHNHWGRWA